MSEKKITFGVSSDQPYKWEEWAVFNQDGAWVYMNGKLYPPGAELPEPKETHVLEATVTPASSNSAGDRHD